jgi:hypothetical protein
MAMTKYLRAFQVAVGDRGQTLRIEMQFEDETWEQIYLAPALAPRLVQSLIQGAATAERMRKAEPENTVSTSTPWRIKDVRTGTVVGTNLFAIGFTTEEGPPLEIVMPRNVAEKTIRSILDDLKGGHSAKRD